MDVDAPYQLIYFSTLGGNPQMKRVPLFRSAPFLILDHIPHPPGIRDFIHDSFGIFEIFEYA